MTSQKRIHKEQNDFLISKDVYNKIKNALFETRTIEITHYMEITPEGKVIFRYDYLIANKSEKSLEYINLTPITKEFQQNIDIRNNLNEKLILTPQNVVHFILTQICHKYLEEIIKKLEEFDEKTIPALNKWKEKVKKSSFYRVFGFEENFDEFSNWIDIKQELFEILKDHSEVKLEDVHQNYLEKISQLVGIYGSAYIPIVKLNKELKKDSFILISLKLERSYLLDYKSYKFYLNSLFGNFPFEFPLSFKENVINHIRIKVPHKTPFVNIKNKNFPILEDNALNKSLKNKLENLDEYCISEKFYLMFTPLESTVIYRSKRIELDINPEKFKRSVIEGTIQIDGTLLFLIITMYLSLISSLFQLNLLPIPLGFLIVACSYSLKQKFLESYLKMHISIFIAILFIYIYLTI